MSIISQALAATSDLGTLQPSNMPISNIGTLVKNGITILFILAGILTFVFLVWGGIEWLTSGGDKTKTEAARNRITAAIIGLAIIAVSWALLGLVTNFLGIDISGNIVLPDAF